MTRIADPRSRKRAGRAVRRQIRREAWKAIVESRGPLGAALLAYLALVAVTGWLTAQLGAGAGAVGFSLGLMLGAIPLVGLSFLVSRGLPHRAMGADAEEWTADELKKLDAKRWTVLHHVPTDRGDIDHVVVGPGRIYAVESKWTTRTDLERFLKGATGQAERQASDLRTILARRGTSRQVIPLLVLWGPGVRLEAFGEKPRLIGSTRVVVGREASDWLARIDGAAEESEADLESLGVLEVYVRERERSTRERFQA